MPEIAHRLYPATADLGRENGAEPVPSEPHGFMRDVDAALMEQVLHVPERKWMPDIHHHREAYDLGRSLEVAENAGVAHPIRLAALLVSGKPFFL
jgi:hypothetical protein